MLNAEDRWAYTDLATAPRQTVELDALALYHATASGEEALAQSAMIRSAQRRKRIRLQRWKRRREAASFSRRIAPNILRYFGACGTVGYAIFILLTL